MNLYAKAVLTLAILAPAAPKGCAAVSGAQAPPGPVTSVCDYAPAGSPAAVKLSKHQRANATDVITVAAERSLPRRAAVIAIATTLQESQLDNGAEGDIRNGKPTAFGVFQQRPVSGWGTYATATNPRVAAEKFFDKLVKVRRWQSRDLTVVAQSVQRSAYPDAYADDEARAERIVDAVTYSTCH